MPAPLSKALIDLDFSGHKRVVVLPERSLDDGSGSGIVNDEARRSPSQNISHAESGRVLDLVGWVHPLAIALWLFDGFGVCHC
jgi:hypothetical protein